MTDTDAGDRPTPAQEAASGTSPKPASGGNSGGEPAQPAGEQADNPAGATSAEGGTGSKSRRRGSRGGRNRNRTRQEGGSQAGSSSGDDRTPELPDRHRENKPSAQAAEAALVRKPQIGDSRPAPAGAGASAGAGSSSAQSQAETAASTPTKTSGVAKGSGQAKRPGSTKSAGGAKGSGASKNAGAPKGDKAAKDSGNSDGDGQDSSVGATSADGAQSATGTSTSAKRRRRRGGRGRGGSGGGSGGVVTAITDDLPVDLDEKTLSKRRGKARKGRPVGRYLMAVHVQPTATQIAVLEGKALIEHYVSRPADEINLIHGNIYVGKVQNVLPGMEAAFVDIGTPKNAVLYRGDTRYDPEDIEEKGSTPRIEEILRSKQMILCQVTKNPIGAKGARLTQEISLPGRFVVLVPNSSTYGISKRLPDNERKRLRQILDKAKPKGHGLIVRTAAEGISAEELERDVQRLAKTWDEIEARANQVIKSGQASLLYRDPDMSIRVIREEFNQDYRQVVIDDESVYEQVRDYVRSISPALVERVVRYVPKEHGGLPVFETFHVHEQLHKALDRKVWLPSGGSLIIERTEALTVIDVNTGKNVGSSSLEETVFRNNLEAAEEVARQLRLRDIGGIIVIDFIDMEIRENRDQVISTFRQALARDKTRTQVFDISELGLVEMTRKRIGEGLIESLSVGCPSCDGRGLLFDEQLIGK